MTDSTNLCPRDGQPIPDTGAICSDCARKLRDSLETLATLIPELATTAAGQTAGASRTGTIGRVGHNDGIRVGAIDVLREVRDVVGGWLDMLKEDGRVNVELPSRDPDGFALARRQCLFLAARVVTIRMDREAQDIADSILDTYPSRVFWREDDEGPFMRPPLVPLVRQVIDTHREEASFREVAGDRLDEALAAFVTVDVALGALAEMGVRVSARQVRRWIDEERMLVRKDMDGNTLVMTGSLVELAATVKRGRRAA